MNCSTGLFIALVRGVYHFEFYIYGHGSSSPGAGAVLVKNGKHVFNSYQRQSTGCLNSSNGATLLLEVGDVVFLREWKENRIFDNENCHTTFSGHLLFIMWTDSFYFSSSLITQWSCVTVNYCHQILQCNSPSNDLIFRRSFIFSCIHFWIA